VDHLSDWHVFDPTDWETYPKTQGAVQVRFDDGQFEEGYTWMFFQRTSLLPSSSIVGWRYIKDVAHR
jgi:hypothetical protein